MRVIRLRCVALLGRCLIGITLLGYILIVIALRLRIALVVVSLSTRVRLGIVLLYVSGRLCVIGLSIAWLRVVLLGVWL